MYVVLPTPEHQWRIKKFYNIGHQKVVNNMMNFDLSKYEKPASP